jgi:hypothetical protein
MSDFNKLELAILEWLRKNYNHRQLSAQIDTARFVKRNWTKVGFFVYFEVSKELEPIDLRDFGTNGWPIDGPFLESEDIENGGDSIIWGKEGYLNCIEMFAYGDFFNEQVTNFELKDKEQIQTNE